jgi:hypothetical protein
MREKTQDQEKAGPIESFELGLFIFCPKVIF